MNWMGFALSLLLTLTWPPQRAQTAAVVVMCEDGGKSVAGDTVEQMGYLALRSILTPFYGKTYWLIGKRATKKAFLSTLQQATRQYRAVDVYLFLHGLRDSHSFADGKLTPKELVQSLKNRGGQRIRMVYTTACYSYYRFLPAWKELGAKAARGMKGVNRPFDFPRFLIGWLLGESYGRANQMGFLWNRQLHNLVNLLRPFLIPLIHKSWDSLRKSPQLSREQKKALLSFLRLLHRWLHPKWKIEESFPHITGPKVRITQLP